MQAAVAQKVAAFFSQYPRRHDRKGQVLIHAHDSPTHIFHLLEGRVKQYDISYRGDEVVLNVFKPPAFFPMSYAINRTPNVYFYEAETEVEFHLAPLEDVVAFIQQNPDVLYNLLARVYRGADGLLGRLAHMMAGNARARVLYELLILARRFGEEQPSGIVISATEGDIGAQAGLARETVNRELNKLKRDGYVVMNKNDIVIPDFDRLAAAISHEL
jgi:CRP/FNR family cyclic AMP-dependent transcriptional regulator